MNANRTTVTGTLSLSAACESVYDTAVASVFVQTQLNTRSRSQFADALLTARTAAVEG